jgi:WD40 repeat protein
MVVLWDIDGKQPRWRLAAHSGDVLGLAFSPDGLTLASTGRDKMVRLWDPMTSQELLTLEGHDAAVAAAVFSPDGNVLATSSEDGKIRLWRATSGGNSKPSFAQQGAQTLRAR